MKLIYYTLFLILSNIVHTLPLFSSSTNTIITSTSLPIESLESISLSQTEEEDLIELIQQEELQEEQEGACPTHRDYGIPVERFAQLVSTHWQFDHLDAIKSGTYKLISEQFQQHIQIHIEPIAAFEENTHGQPKQKTFHMLNTKWDMMMDLEILQAQIFGAIQAHTEGSLHIAWDQLSDKISQPTFELFIRSVAAEYCTLDEQVGVLSSTCLKEKAALISLTLDEYINSNLNRVFEALESNILPNLLANTSQDLKGVLNYFNRLFLSKDNQHLSLQISPWSTETIDLQSKLHHLLENSSVDEHLQDFFQNYACLSRA